jgi:uncharacterized protein affecting Mg2+/Co2+ transport
MSEYQFRVEVAPRIPARAIRLPEQDLYVFAYTVTHPQHRARCRRS